MFQPKLGDFYMVELWNITIYVLVLSSKQFPHRVNSERFVGKALAEIIIIGDTV